MRSFLRALCGTVSWRVWVAVGLTASVSLTEGLGLLLLVPLLQTVGFDVQQGGLGRVERLVSSGFALAGVRPALTTVLGVYISVIGLRAALTRWQTTAVAVLQQEFVGRLRERLYGAIARTSWSFFSRQRASTFTHALTIELERAGGAASDLVGMLAQLLLVCAYLAVALQISPVLTLLALGSGSILLLLMRRQTERARALGEALSEAGSELYASAGEHLAGMKIARAHGDQARHIARFQSVSVRLGRSYADAFRGYAAARQWFEIGSVLILSVVLYVSLQLLALPIAAVLLLILLFARLVPRLSELHQGWQRLVNGLPAFATVADLLSRCEREAEPVAEPFTAGRAPGALNLSEGVRYEIRLEGVSFGYDARADSPAITSLTLAIPAGRTTAIVGPSGAGKTTVADLLLGLLEPDRGRILVDGAPLTAWGLAAWRQRVGYVPQDAFLFHDTIRANLQRADPEATEPELWDALRLAAADRFVAAMPAGLDTLVGDRGGCVSGGERQRLALARALLRRPALLVLDEPTSALDAENERRILHAIGRLHEALTIVIVSHRLSIARGADLIHVIEHGRLVESGSWTSLLARSGRFRALCALQGLAGELVPV